LYDLEEGYFTAARANAPVGSVGKALAFSQLAGEDGYRRAVREAYDSLEVGLLVDSLLHSLRYLDMTCPS